MIGELGRPDGPGGAGRRRPAQAGLGARCGGPSSSRRASDEPRPRRRRRRRAVQRRTVAHPGASPRPSARVGITIGIATASLLARDLSGSEALAGLAQTSQVLGAAVASYLLARVMSRTRPPDRAGHRLPPRRRRAPARGRRRRRRLDAAAAGRRRAARRGHGGQQRRAVRRHRPRAADAPRAGAVDRGLGDHDRRRAPAPTSPGRPRPFADRLGIPELTGPFALGASACSLAALSWSASCCGPTRCCVAREAAGEPLADARAGTSWDRAPAWPSASGRCSAAPIAGLARAHAAMIGVMVMTPLHMEHGGAELRVIGIVISVHVLGMFAFSPLVGLLADRLGRAPVLALGGVILLLVARCCAPGRPRAARGRSSPGCSCSASAGRFATVAASTMIADHAPLEARTDVQGTADLVMGADRGRGRRAGRAGRRGVAGYPALALRHGCRWRLLVGAASVGPACARRAGTVADVSSTPDRARSPSSAAPASTPSSTTPRSTPSTRRTATPSAPGRGRHRRGPPVAFLPRHGPAPRVPAARDQLPRQPLGAALARRPAGARALRGRRAARRGRARRRRGARPARRPHLAAAIQSFVETGARAPAVRRPLLRAAVGARSRRPTPTVRPAARWW